MNETLDPPPYRAGRPSEPFDVKDRPPHRKATTGEGYGTNTTDAKEGPERVEKAKSSSPDNTREYQAIKETWTPLTGGINSGRPADQCKVALDADPTHEISSSAPRIACHPAVRNQAPPDDGSEDDGG